MADSRMEQNTYKMILEHVVVLGSYEMLTKNKPILMGVCQDEMGQLK